jgi:hypothetical protein
MEMTQEKTLKELVEEVLSGDDRQKKEDIINIILKALFSNSTHSLVEICVGMDNNCYTYRNVPGNVLSFCFYLLEDFQENEEDDDY